MHEILFWGAIVVLWIFCGAINCAVFAAMPKQGYEDPSDLCGFMALLGPIGTVVVAIMLALCLMMLLGFLMMLLGRMIAAPIKKALLSRHSSRSPVE